MSNQYDNDPRYEFMEENVYFDTQTNETVFLLDEDASDAIQEIISVDPTMFILDDHQDEYKLTEEGAKKLFENIFNSDLNEL